MAKPVEHHWYGCHRFDIWQRGESYAFSVDMATVCTGSLEKCKDAWIRESSRHLREEAFRQRGK